MVMCMYITCIPVVFRSVIHVHSLLLLFTFPPSPSLSFPSRETYNALTNWLTDARTLASPNIVIVLVGNKKDLEADREVTFMEASRFAQENGMYVHAFLLKSARQCYTVLQSIVLSCAEEKCKVYLYMHYSSKGLVSNQDPHYQCSML